MIIEKIKNSGNLVKCYIHDGYWVDIGSHEEYERASKDFDDIKYNYS